MNQLKKYITFSIIVFCFGTMPTFAQRIWSNPVGQYAYNPSGACYNDLGELLVSYYNTYASANNSPQGALLMGSTSLPTDNMGVGFKFVYEKGGVLSNLMAEATYVYKVNLGNNHKLGLGLSGTFQQTALQDHLVNAQHPDDRYLMLGAESDYWFDVNFGLSFYKPNHYFIGIAAYNLVGQHTSWMLPNFEGRTSRLLTVSGLYDFFFLQGDIKLELAAEAMMYVPFDKFSLVYDVTAKLQWRKYCWIGGGYTNNIAKIMAGVYIQNFAIGYAGGIGVGEISNFAYAFPQHEVFLRLEFNTSKWSKRQRNNMEQK
jgi:type IX secretion system PorP/SprF family membrane protein